MCQRGWRKTRGSRTGRERRRWFGRGSGWRDGRRPQQTDGQRTWGSGSARLWDPSSGASAGAQTGRRAEGSMEARGAPAWTGEARQGICANSWWDQGRAGLGSKGRGHRRPPGPTHRRNSRPADCLERLCIEKLHIPVNTVRLFSKGSRGNRAALSPFHTQDMPENYLWPGCFSVWGSPKYVRHEPLAQKFVIFLRMSDHPPIGITWSTTRCFT
jgi:hypothetical protein